MLSWYTSQGNGTVHPRYKYTFHSKTCKEDQWVSYHAIVLYLLPCEYLTDADDEYAYLPPMFCKYTSIFLLDKIYQSVDSLYGFSFNVRGREQKTTLRSFQTTNFLQTLKSCFVFVKIASWINTLHCTIKLM